MEAISEQTKSEATMWKKRVLTCLQLAVDELLAEAEKCSVTDATMRTEFDGMVRQTRLVEIAARLKEHARDIESLPERKQGKS